MKGVPLSPEPEVRSHREPSRSVYCRGGGALGAHVPHQVLPLGADLLADGLLKGLAGEVGKVVVGQELQLQLIGLARQPCGVGGETTGSASSQMPLRGP